MSDRDKVRELAVNIANGCRRMRLHSINTVREWVESRLRTFLTEQEREEKKMAETVMVMFETDDYRGDHAAERRVMMREFDPMARLADVLEQANALKTTHGDRATVTILPEVLEKEVAGG